MHQLDFSTTHTNARWWQKHIHSQDQDGHILVARESKVVVAFDFFNSILGVLPARANGINLHNLDLPCLDLGFLCERFTKDEV
jgi:hypothetical protein